MVTVAPAFTARLNMASAFSTMRWMVTGEPLSDFGPTAPHSGISSTRNNAAPLMRMHACIRRPSGPGMRISSTAPKAFLYQSIACAAPATTRWGVTAVRPSGMAFTLLIWVSSKRVGLLAAVQRPVLGLRPRWQHEFQVLEHPVHEARAQGQASRLHDRLQVVEDEGAALGHLLGGLRSERQVIHGEGDLDAARDRLQFVGDATHRIVVTGEPVGMREA